MTRFDFVFDSDSTTPDFCSFLTSLFIYVLLRGGIIIPLIFVDILWKRRIILFIIHVVFV